MLETPQNQLESLDDTFTIFAKNSTDNEDEVEEATENFNNLVEKLKQTDIPDSNLGKAKHVLNFLEKEGYAYMGNIFLAPDVFRYKSGNCVSLTLLVASLVERVGGETKIKEISETKDSAYRDAEKYVNSLMDGLSEVKYDSLWPIEKKDDLGMRFTSAGHFVLEVDGEELEVTDFGVGKQGEGVIEKISQEKILDLKKAIASVVTSRLAEIEKKSNYDLQEMEKLAKQGLELDPNKSSLYLSLHKNAFNSFADEKSEEYFDKYLELMDQSTALSHFNKYLQDDNKEELEKAYKIFPADVSFFMYKNIKELLKDGNETDARFYFKVMAHCVANSEFIDLPEFYLRYGEFLVQLCKPKTVERIFEGIGAQTYEPLEYPLVMALATKDPTYVKEAITEGLWPSIPYKQLLWSLIGQKVKDTKSIKEFRKLEEQYGQSKIFQNAVESFKDWSNDI